MNTKFVELLARLPGRDDIARGEMVKKADAVATRLTAMLGRLDPETRREALDLIVEEVMGRSRKPNNGVGPDGRPTPEFLAWEQRTFDMDLFASGAREIERTGGVELKDIIDELNRGRQPDERVA
ncbi:MAG: hypothetical protein U0797_30680 [Gemmataceae bacterium]